MTMTIVCLFLCQNSISITLLSLLLHKKLILNNCFTGKKIKEDSKKSYFKEVPIIVKIKIIDKNIYLFKQFTKSFPRTEELNN